MKKNRIIWGITWICSVVVISIFGGHISYGFFWCVTLLPLLSLLYLLCVYLSFHVYQRIDSWELVVNRTIPFRFALVNEYPFGLAGIKIKLYSDFSEIKGLVDDIEYELMPKSRIDVETELTCRYRGHYKVGVSKIVLQDFFRLFSITCNNRQDYFVVVKPQLVRISKLKINEHIYMMQESNNAQTQVDVLTHEYYPGEDIRLIDWRQSARIGKLMVRERIGEEKHFVTIITDTFRISDEINVYLPSENKVLETSLALAYYFFGEGVNVQGYYYNEGICNMSVNPMTDFNRYYEGLSSVNFNKAGLYNEFYGKLKNDVVIFQSGIVFLVIGKWDESVIGLLGRLNEMRILTFVYCIFDAMPDMPQLTDYNLLTIIKVNPEDNLEEVL